LSAMRRSIGIARDYAHRRTVFGKKLSSQPLHLSTLTDMELEFKGCFKLFFDVLYLFGLVETGKSTNKQNMLFRFLLPIIKLYTAKSCAWVVVEVMESLGGTGYMEDSWIPAIIRNSLVNIIWEGTTNVLSLDVWRTIIKDNGLDVYLSSVKERSSKLKGYTEEKLIISNCVNLIEKYVSQIKDRNIIESTARLFSFSLARLYIGLLLIEHAEWSNEHQDIIAAKRWFIDRDIWLLPLFETLEERNKENHILAMNVDSQGIMRGVGDIGIDGNKRHKL